MKKIYIIALISAAVCGVLLYSFLADMKKARTGGRNTGAGN